MLARLLGKRKLARGERGQTLVEFAVVALAFLLMMVGILDLGRAVYAYNAIANAAREGARCAIVSCKLPYGCSGAGCTCSTSCVTTAAKAEAGFIANDITVTTTGPSSDSYGTYYTVSVSWPFTPIAVKVTAFTMNTSSKMYQ